MRNAAHSFSFLCEDKKKGISWRGENRFKWRIRGIENVNVKTVCRR